MADNKTPKVSRATIKSIDKLDSSFDELNKSQNDISKVEIDLLKSSKDITNDINNTVNSVFNDLMGGFNHSNPVGSEVNTILNLARSNGKNIKENKKALESFKSSVNSRNNEYLHSLFESRRQNKIPLYEAYDLILKAIPKMRLAIDTWVQSIISPDDFTKNSIYPYFDTGSVTDSVRAETMDKLKSIIEKYKINDKIKSDIEEFLVKGERFYYVGTINNEIKSLLKESSSSMYTSFGSSLNENFNYNNYQDKLFINENLSLFEDVKDIKDTDVLNSLNEVLEKCFVLSNSSEFIVENAATTTNSDPFSAFRVNVHKNRPEDAKEGLFTSDQVDKFKLDKDSAVLKRLDSLNVIKLEFEETCYGYLYIDTKEEVKETKLGQGTFTGVATSNTNNAFSSVLYSSNDINEFNKNLSANSGMNNNLSNVNAKLKFIAASFANKLDKKTNLKFIKKNDHLKEIIYNTLRVNKIVNKDSNVMNKVRITYFTPDEVVHIDRGQSVFDNVLFFCKLYVATLIATLMQNVVRGGGHRAFYVEVGLDNDSASQMNSVIREVKQKEVTNLHSMDMTSILNVVGVIGAPFTNKLVSNNYVNC